MCSVMVQVRKHVSSAQLRTMTLLDVVLPSVFIVLPSVRLRKNKKDDLKVNSCKVMEAVKTEGWLKVRK